MGRKLKLTIEVDIDRVKTWGGITLIGKDSRGGLIVGNTPDFTVHTFGWDLDLNGLTVPAIYIQQQVEEDGKAPSWVGTPAETAIPAMPKLETAEANLTEKSAEIRMGGGANLNGAMADSNILIN